MGNHRNPLRGWGFMPPSRAFLPIEPVVSSRLGRVGTWSHTTGRVARAVPSVTRPVGYCSVSACLLVHWLNAS